METVELLMNKMELRRGLIDVYIQDQMLGAQCVAAEVHPPNTKLPKNVPPRTDMKYPTFMVMTANMLHEKSASGISM
jgi:hypothetical protein